MTSRMSAPLPRSRLTPAPVGDRVIAGAIDLVACGLVVAALGLLIGLFMDSTVLAWAIAGLIVGVPREIALAVTGWSPGGRLRGVRLVDVETGGPPGGRLLLHLDLLLITVVPTFGLGAVVLLHSAARDPHGQGYHDRVAGLRAVTVRGGAAASDPSAQPGWTGRDTETGSPMFFRPGESPEGGGRGTTFDTSAMGSSSDDASQALIDSVPWAAVPTHLDPPTSDDLAVLPPEAGPGPAAGPTGPGPGGPSGPGPGGPSGPRRAGSSAPSGPVAPTGSAGPTGPAGPAESTPGAYGSYGTPIAPRAYGPSGAPGAAGAPAGPPGVASAPRTSSAPGTSGAFTGPPGVASAPRAASAPRTSSAPGAASAPGTGDPSGRATSGLDTLAIPQSAPASAAATSAAPTGWAAQASADDTMVLDAPDTRTRRRTARHRRRTDEQTIVLVPDTGGESIPLPEPTVVGRDPRNISAYPQAQRASIFDPSRSVSKTHALLVPVPGGVWVTDLHSTNGTRIESNGAVTALVPEKEEAAMPGSKVVFGNAVYRVSVSEP
ncbi:RDD family protein [Actinomyces dentalis]|uniref:RDD family protein n=1 Tax=Actinomyces dentalis TaxID=272548 RepID=UPI0028EC03FC|nr:RDD family protein [Actinomyces dentalis]